MSGGGGGPIIIGGGDIAEILEKHMDKIAVFRQARVHALLEAYYNNHNSIDSDDNQFLLRCVQDIVDNR
jgi:hypothetical protein